MRKLFALMLCLFVAPAFAQAVRVRGYVKKDGTYVQPHYRSAPNSAKSDNWSTQGNYNPYTGEKGTKRVDPSPSTYDRSDSSSSSSDDTSDNSSSGGDSDP
jgi:hypothetical protein